LACFEAATFLDSGDKALKYLGLQDDELENLSSTSSESLQENVIIFFLSPSSSSSSSSFVFINDTISGLRNKYYLSCLLEKNETSLMLSQVINY